MANRVTPAFRFCLSNLTLTQVTPIRYLFFLLSHIIVTPTILNFSRPSFSFIKFPLYKLFLSAIIVEYGPVAQLGVHSILESAPCSDGLYLKFLPIC